MQQVVHSCDIYHSSHYFFEARKLFWKSSWPLAATTSFKKLPRFKEKYWAKSTEYWARVPNNRAAKCVQFDVARSVRLMGLY